MTNVAQSFINFLDEVDARDRTDQRDKVRMHVAFQMARTCVTMAWHAQEYTLRAARAFVVNDAECEHDLIGLDMACIPTEHCLNAKNAKSAGKLRCLALSGAPFGCSGSC